MDLAAAIELGVSCLQCLVQEWDGYQQPGRLSDSSPD